ncbi:LysR substrate-binding domain-containing protein [Mesorhizobium sp. 8]|uniref:LysR substrate-binding domain-containing protein n=1 Tax=Mesorhizobium sp. 8 TaxID=2584466 RepID=UPI001FEDF162|nr:LysR substrate-binding domain-containing protein [Mesorhizobium sp. 8]
MFKRQFHVFQLTKNQSKDHDPPMVLPSLNGMRAFEAAARLGSVKDAAEELRLTPSAVSRHIRFLERSLGQDLFERSFRQITLTATGSYYAHSLSEAFEAIRRATEDVSLVNGAGKRHKRIRFMCEPTFLNLWLVDRLPSFRRLHPSIDLEISTSGKRSDFDLAVVDEFNEKTSPALKLILPLMLTPVCSPALLNGPEPLRTPQDLLHHCLIHERESRRWERWLGQEGVVGEASGAATVLHDCTLIMREVANGTGIALADTIMAQDLLQEGRLVAPFNVYHDYPAGYYLHQRPGVGSKPEITQFLDWLFAEIEQHKKSVAPAFG